MENYKSLVLFENFHILQRIWSHPLALRFDRDKKKKDGGDDGDEDSLTDFIVNDNNDSNGM